jgi:hypothetical protein
VSLLLDGGQKSLVDGLLVLDAVLGGLLLLSHVSVLSRSSSIVNTYLGLLALLEERILTRLVGGLVLGEVTVLASLLDNLLVYALQVDLGGGGNDISGVYSSKGNTVDFEGTGNKEDTLGEVLEDNDALAAEATSKEDDDGTGLEGLANLRRADRLAGLESQLAELPIDVLILILPHPDTPAACCRSKCTQHPCSPSLACKPSSIANVPSWGQQRPQQGSTCWPSASGAVSTSPPWRTSGWWASCPLVWPPFRFAVVVSAGRWCWRWDRIFVNSNVCQAVQSIRATGPPVVPSVT